jgi:hypothetical protein
VQSIPGFMIYFTVFADPFRQQVDIDLQKNAIITCINRNPTPICSYF